jgi:hypothetical protein
MAQYVPEFNAGNTEDRLQIDGSTQTLRVYAGGAWKALGQTGAAGGQSAGLIGTTSVLLAENVPHWAATANTTALATGVMTSVAIYLPKGLTVTSIGHQYATTASSPGHVWAALYDTSATPALIGQSTDITNESGTAYSIVKHTLATAYTIPTSGVYYAGLMATTTVPTLATTVAAANAGFLTGSGFLTGAFDVCVKSGSSLTTTAPSTITSTTVQTTIPWVGIF